MMCALYFNVNAQVTVCVYVNYFVLCKRGEIENKYYNYQTKK